MKNQLKPKKELSALFSLTKVSKIKTKQIRNKYLFYFYEKFDDDDGTNITNCKMSMEILKSCISQFSIWQMMKIFDFNLPYLILLGQSKIDKKINYEILFIFIQK